LSFGAKKYSMKLRQIIIHNFRSVIDADIEAHDYMLLVGANNAGKSTILNALRVFYEDIKWSPEDFPKHGWQDQESWVDLRFELDDQEWEGLADEYKADGTGQFLRVRRYFKSEERNRVQSNQSNIYGFVNGKISTDLFYGAKNVGTAKVGQMIYVPALATPADQTKMSGPSPLRNMLNFLLKKVVSKSEAFKQIHSAFEKLNEEAGDENGFLKQISTPLNAAIKAWSIKMNLSFNSIAPEDISKSLVKLAFQDTALGIDFDLERYGHGFQRSVIYELIRLAPTFKDERKFNKKEFNPLFNLILFEEPEAFLHPSQQEIMAYKLRCLGKEDGQQVFITTHSPIFAGKAAEEIGQIVRVQRSEGVTKVFQPRRKDINELFEQGGELLEALRRFVEDPQIDKNKKGRARKMIKEPPQNDEIATQEERFRFQLWLDGERSSLFFADKVLLVEGPTERTLFNYLLSNNWHDLSAQHICIVDVLGKFNFHRFLALVNFYGIPHGIMLDDDSNSKDKDFHGAINDLVENSINSHTLAPPVKFPGCLEAFLGLEIPDRSDKKPLEIMKAITSQQIGVSKLQHLRQEFCKALSID
jgi:predicted ATP-dependent endonuclease of OLD family